jgi:hypothetical protein
MFAKVKSQNILRNSVITVLSQDAILSLLAGVLYILKYGCRQSKLTNSDASRVRYKQEDG